MKKVGIIGYGSMGSMILNGFLASKVLEPNQVIVSSRTQSRLECLEEQWPGIEIAEGNKTLAQKCNRILICVKPLDVKGVLDEIVEYLHSDVHIISIAACITIGDIERIFPGKITRVMPSLTSEVGEGVSLICHNSHVGPEDAEYVERLFSAISTVKTIQEKNFEVAADLTSCAPGLIAAIFQEFAEAGVRHSDLTREEAEDMVVSTLYGTSKLLYEKRMQFPEMISRVATKGGITEEGVKVLQKSLPSVFDEVFEKTLSKYERIKTEVRKQFASDSTHSNTIKTPP